ncbi:MAG: chemotaxis protein CheW [Thermodesulfobacteriota bacterium]|nr:chemotaxis protein CheW [Thermodesulfobacteriota bacterium]
MTEVQAVVQRVDAAQGIPMGDMDGMRASADKGSKYLTFTLAGEDDGIGIRKIKEIIGMMPITSVPQTPAHIKGVIKLRVK